MGMPISSYTILSAIADESVTYEIELAERVLRPFKLFAFIIHDPEMHQRFHDFLAHQFDRLDYVTGRRLLFFALVDPPQSWLDHRQDRDYCRLFTQLKGEEASRETRELLNPDNVPASTDKSNTAFSLASALNIPIEKLPCIVVTQGFQLKDFHWFRTSPDRVEEQLIRLGYIADRAERPMSEIKSNWRELDLCSSHGLESLSDSLARVLSDVLSFIVAGAEIGKRQGSWIQSKALSQADDAVKRLYASIDYLKNANEEHINEELDRLCICLISFLAQLNNRRRIDLNEFLNIHREHLEYDSFQILRTAYKVYDMLSTSQFKLPVKRDVGEVFDFTPGVICMAKVFEKEANLAVVHWARKELGISLPQYFNKPQPGVTATVVPQIPGGREIDLNMNRNGKWLPPGIGQSEIACQELSLLGLPDEWDSTSWYLLLNIWRRVRVRRNEAAHSELMSETSMLEVRDMLQEMAEQRLFEKFYKMKQRYRGAR